MPLWGFAICFLCAALWTASPIMVSRGMEISNCSGYEINLIRSLSFFASSLVIALVASRGHITIVTDPVAYCYFFIGVALSYIIGDAFYFTAMKVIGVSLAIPVANAYPIFATLTSWLLLGEAATLRIFIGVSVVVAGVMILRLGTLEESESPMDRAITPGKGRIFRGFLFALGAGLCWAVSAPFTKLALLRSGLSPIELTFYRSLALVVSIWAWRFVQLRYTYIATVPLRTVPPAAWLYFLGAAVIGLCFGSIIYAASINVMPVAIVTAITSTSPFMSALYGHFVLRERLRPLQWSGVAMIIAGSVFVSL